MEKTPSGADECSVDLATARQGSARRTIRFQLLLAVNATMAGLVVVYLVIDYRHELLQRVEEKRIALEEESKTLYQAIAQLRHVGLNAVRDHVDAVCVRMRTSQSPGHHIAVQWDGNVVHASAHQRASSEMFDAMLAATRSPDHRAWLGKTELVVGTHEQDGLSVYVSEHMKNVRQSVLRDVLRRLTGLFGLAVVSALVVNLVLIRTVTRPLDRLVATVQSIGKGQFGVQSHDFQSAELNYLSEAINEMSRSLATVDRERKLQMAKAREIQQHLLPQGREIPGLRMTHLYYPADDVAGDYYDVLRLPDQTWLFCVADVTGHGVPAAMSAAMLKTLLLQATERLTKTEEIISFINERFAKVILPGDFASMLLLRVIPKSRTLQYASAGHETAWLLSGTATRELPSTGMLLGISGDATWTTETMSVSPGNRLLMVTDGVTEMFNARQECFGRQRLAELLTSCGDLTLEETALHMDQSLSAFRQGCPLHDDVTLVLVEVSTA